MKISLSGAVKALRPHRFWFTGELKHGDIVGDLSGGHTEAYLIAYHAGNPYRVDLVGKLPTLPMTDTMFSRDRKKFRIAELILEEVK